MQPPPLTVFSRSLQNAKSDLGHIGNLFYILCGNVDEKNEGTTLPGGRVSRQSQRVRGGCNLFHFFDILSRHFGKYPSTMKLKLTEHV